MSEVLVPPADLEELADRLKALSNPRRLALLADLRTPMYLEEIATRLKMARQSAQEHVTALLEARLIEKRPGDRASGPVVEYVVVQSAYFALLEDLRALGAKLPEREDALARTQVGDAKPSGAKRDLPELVVVGGLRTGLSTTLHRGASAPPVLLGRDPVSGLVLDWDLMVSNRHVEVRGTATGHAAVDMFSRNGTLLNGARLAPGTAHPLQPGDILQLGRTLVVYR